MSTFLYINSTNIVQHSTFCHVLLYCVHEFLDIKRWGNNKIVQENVGIYRIWVYFCHNSRLLSKYQVFFK